MSAITAAWRRFFFDFEVSRAKVELLRMVFFALLAIDAFFQIEHAPRYGAGDFNVAHFGWMDTLLPMPGRETMMVLFMLQAYLAFRVMAGVTVRWSIAALTVLFGYTYFISQVNSYQHYYLLFLLLILFNVFPWRAMLAGDNPRENVQGWAVRGMLVQVSILYMWTAIAKMDPRWIEGITLRMQVTDETFRGLLIDVAKTLGVKELTLWAVASVAVMVGELALAVAIHIRRLWPVLLPLGALFHMSIEFSGFKIGLFSYFMVALYILIIPERWMVSAAAWLGGAKAGAKKASRPRKKKKSEPEPEQGDGQVEALAPEVGGGSEGLVKGAVLVIVLGAIGSGIGGLENVEWMAALVGFTFLLSLAIQYYPGRWLTLLADRIGAALGTSGADARSWGPLLAAVALGSAILWSMPFSEAPVFIGAIAVAALLLDATGGKGRLQRALVHLVVCLLLVGLHKSTDQALDYYRYMGGDARRRGDMPTAIHAYTQATLVDPGYAPGHRRLGDLYMRTREFPKAAAAYQHGVSLEPNDPGYLLPLAKALAAAGQAQEAAKVVADLEGRPLNAAAQQEVLKLKGSLGAPGLDSGPDEDSPETDDGG